MFCNFHTVRGGMCVQAVFSPTKRRNPHVGGVQRTRSRSLNNSKGWFGKAFCSFWSPTLEHCREAPRGGRPALMEGLSGGEVERHGRDAPVSASHSRCATCGPRTSLTLVPLLFHRFHVGPVLAVRGELPQDEPQSPSRLKPIDFSLLGRVSAARAARACPPNR